MNIHFAKNADEDCWNKFALEVSDSPFHLFQWKGIFEKVYDYECQFMLAEDKGEIVGIFPMAVIRSRWFGFRMCSLPFLDYGGPLFRLEKADLGLCLKSFIDSLRSNAEKVDYVEIRSPPQVEAFDYLKGIFHTGNVKYLSFLINLNRSFSEIWQKDFNSDMRRKIRKAAKNGISIAEQNFAEVSDEFYHAYLLAMKRLGSPPHRIEFFDALFKMLGTEHTKFFSIAVGNRLIGGAIVFLGNSTMHYGYEVVTPECKSLRPTYLLYSEMLKWGCENGFHVFDTGRTLYGSGVYSFKRQWKGTENFLPYYYRGKKIPKEDPREKFSALSRLWSEFLPLSLTSKIGWRIKAGVGH